MDELEFYNGIWTGQQIDDAIGRTGYAKALLDTDNLNSVIDNGFYYWAAAPLNAPTGLGYAYMVVIRRTDSNVTQIIYRGGNQILMRQMLNDAWSNWEWVSGMPMTADVEYETTERFNGKVVYCQLKSIGSIAANATTNNYAFFSSGLAAHGTIIRHSVFGNLSTTNWLSMPYDDGSTVIKVRPLYYSNGSTWGARLYVDTNKALTNVTAMLWYTKD